ncbi:MAG: glycoside hydrolase family 16 protein [Clostridia bacterium]|nr:glycoside hydrolase family 16 protein [Clostridia bacterium]
MKKGTAVSLLALILCFSLLMNMMPVFADEDCSRIEFLELICEKAKVSEGLYEGEFADVSESDDCASLIAGALDANVLDTTFADDEGNFNPDEPITKETAVAIVVKALNKMKNDLSVGVDLEFEDKDEIDDKYLTYIEVAAANDVIENEGVFEPKKELTVTEAAQMAEDMVEAYKSLPVVSGSGIRRIQFPVIEDTDITPPDFLEEGYQLVFDDEFDGDTLDTTKWSYNYSWGHSHNHAAWCVEENVIVSDGVLTLKGENVQHPDAVGKQGTFNNKKYDIIYTSGAINTHHKYNFTYGYFEARLKMPKGKGMWPAWWMLKDGWPPEIDMLEILCSNPTKLHVNYHYGSSWDKEQSHEQVLDLGFDSTDDFHTYGFEWTPDYMKYYVDGVQVGSTYTNKSAIAQSTGMYMILNLAIDGWDGTPDETTEWPALYQCDYVRVWQLNE